LSPMSAAGDVIYGGTSGAGTALAIGTAGQVLTVNSGATAPQWSTPSSGTVTSVGGTGTVNGITLTGTVTSSGNLTLGGTLDLSSPPAIGGTTESTGRFTTVTSTVATGTAPFTVASTTPVTNLSIGGNAGTVTNGVYTTDTGTVTNTMLAGSIANAKLTNSSITFGSTAQALGSTVSGLSGVTIDNGVIGGNTAVAGTFTTLISNSTAQFGKSSVNYLQVVGGATTVAPALTVQSSSDTNVDFLIKSLGTGSTLIGTGNGTAISAADSGATVAWWQFTGTASSTGNLISRVGGGGTNTTLISVAKGTGTIQFATANTATNVQMQVSNTASAVNYVQVTGGATTVRPRIDFTGSDGNVGGAFVAKGSGAFLFASDANASTIQFFISRTGSATNYLQVTGGATGSAPVLSAQGSSDTDVDITFTPKGAGVIKFGTYTVSALLPVAGYITIKDSGGTSRRLLVG